MGATPGADNGEEGESENFYHDSRVVKTVRGLKR